MVRCAADLELRLQLVANQLSESPYSHIWMNGLSASAATKTIKDLAKANASIDETSRGKLEGLLKQCDSLFQRRHAYVHGAWSVDVSGPNPAPQVMRFTRGQQTPRFDDVSTEDLVDLTQQLITVTDEVMQWFVQRLNAGPKTARSIIEP